MQPAGLFFRKNHNSPINKLFWVPGKTYYCFSKDNLAKRGFLKRFPRQHFSVWSLGYIKQHRLSSTHVLCRCGFQFIVHIDRFDFILIPFKLPMIKTSSMYIYISMFFEKNIYIYMFLFMYRYIYIYRSMYLYIKVFLSFSLDTVGTDIYPCICTILLLLFHCTSSGADH